MMVSVRVCTKFGAEYLENRYRGSVPKDHRQEMT